MFYSIGKILITMIAWLDMLIATTFIYFLAFLPKPYTQAWYPRIFRWWCWIFIRALGVELKLQQKNLYPLPKHYILIGNHPSVFEDLGMPALFPARFLAKEELRDWWIFGKISIAADTLYVKRESSESRKQAKIELYKALEKGDSIALYPEGGCKGRRIYFPFQRGAFEAALKTGVQIIPVFLHYEAQETFEWQENESLIQKLWRIMNSQNKTANYYVFDAIDPKFFDKIDDLRTHVEALYLQWQKKYLE